MPTRDEVFAMGFVMPIVTCVAVCLRFYARRRHARLGIDYFFVAFAWAVLVTCCVLQLVGVFRYGYGQHSGNGTAITGLTDDKPLLTSTKRISDIINLLIPWALTGCKLGLLFFYRRIFRGKMFEICLWSTTFFVVAWAITFFFNSLFQCGIHITRIWASAQVVKENCNPGAPVEMWMASWDVFCDLCILAIPLYWIRKVQLSRGQKYLVTLLFAFGGVAIIASVIRLVVYSQIFPKHNENPDQMQYVTSIAYWSILETSLAIIAACLPTYGNLLTEDQRRRLGNHLADTLPWIEKFGLSSKSGLSATSSYAVSLPYEVAVNGKAEARQRSSSSDGHNTSNGHAPEAKKPMQQVYGFHQAIMNGTADEGGQGPRLQVPPKGLDPKNVYVDERSQGRMI